MGGALVAKSDNLNSLPRTFMVEEITNFHGLCSTFDMHVVACARPTLTDNKINVKKKIKTHTIVYAHPHTQRQ